jgi:hypothetical protein
MNAITPGQIEIEPCELCGGAIEDLEELIYLRAADMIAQWERADPRDAWKHTGEAPPPDHIRNGPQAAAEPAFYRTARSTEAAFKYVCSLNDADYLTRWLANHPADAPELFKIWKGK